MRSYAICIIIYRKFSVRDDSRVYFLMVESCPRGGSFLFLRRLSYACVLRRFRPDRMGLSRPIPFFSEEKQAHKCTGFRFFCPAVGNFGFIVSFQYIGSKPQSGYADGCSPSQPDAVRWIVRLHMPPRATLPAYAPICRIDVTMGLPPLLGSGR